MKFDGIGKKMFKPATFVENLYFALPVLLLFGVVYFCSTTFSYVEGDDALSVAFHAFGRDSYIQHPYSAYHGMMDVFLWILPADETLLRHAIILITAISAVLAVLLAFSLVYEWLQLRGSKVILVTFLILLCVPEIFYLSLCYTPTYTALMFVLVAHKLLRQFVNFRKDSANKVSDKIVFAASAIAFGIGTACRWDVGLYLVVIVADVLFGNRFDESVDAVSDTSRQNSFIKKIKLAALYAASAVSTSVIAVIISGYGIADFLKIFKLAKKEITSGDSMFSMIGAFQPFFTPAFLLFFAVGYALLWMRKRNLAVFIAVGIFPFLIYTYSREPKMLLPALPCLFLALAAGIDFVWFKIKKISRPPIIAVAVLLILSPWLVGAQIYSQDTLWGPGFEIKTVRQNSQNKNENVVLQNRVGDHSVAINNFAASFNAGFAIPTPEGPRPIGGHFYVLFGGQWRALVEKLNEERNVAFQKAVSENVPILQYGRNADIATKFSEMGYKTSDSYNAISPDGIYIRRFSNVNRETVVYAPNPPAAFFTKRMIRNLIQLDCKKVVLYSAYTSAMKKLNDIAPESMEALGPITATVDLESLVRSEKLPE